MSLHCSQRPYFVWFHLFKVYGGLFCDLICVCLFWRMVRVCLRRMYIWLLFGGVSSASTPGWSATSFRPFIYLLVHTLGRLLWSWGYICNTWVPSTHYAPPAPLYGQLSALSRMTPSGSSGSECSGLASNHQFSSVVQSCPTLQPHGL